MTQQFNACCFTVFTGGITQAFIGNHCNLGHGSTMELTPSAGCAEVKIDLPHPDPNDDMDEKLAE